jgi:integrase
MQSERKGRSRFRDFERNAGQMRMLFQHFVQNFYTKEQNRFSVSAERAVKWEAQPEDAEAEQVLPQMRVDVVLSSPERWVLIDTKFTAHSMDRHPRSEPSHPKAWRVKKIQVVGSVRRGGADEPERSLAQHQQPRLLEPAEVAGLLAEMPDHLHALVACAVYAGLRRSELFHLRWEDVDLKEGELRVVSRADHPTKNSETRHIPMSAALEDALIRHPHRLGSPYVFVNAEGKPYDNIRKSLNSAAERAGITEGVGLHQLRHCFISQCAMASVDPRTLMKWAGHHDLKTTMGYSHVSADHAKTAIERLQYHHGHPAVTETG